MSIEKLDAAIKAVCPIHGISVGRIQDKSTWRIDFADEATEAQRALAADVVTAYVWPAQKDYAVRRREEYNRRGVTFEAIAEALIEHAGARPQKLQHLMTIRDEVRAQIPRD